MALTPSTMLALGTVAPDFSLPDTVTGRVVSPQNFPDARGLAIIFMCNHCPYVKHIADGVAAFARDYAPRGIALIGISSNDPGHRAEDGPEQMAEEAQRRGYTFPYLFDETQSVAKAYRAACTPDLFLFDAGRRLVYRGQFDDSRPGNNLPVTGRDLRAAADALLDGRPVDPVQTASIGCNIKWKPGNEPDYFG